MSRDIEVIVSAVSGAIAGAISSRLSANAAAGNSSGDPEVANRRLEQWKEINEYARHWETLMFESAKSYFTVIALALGGAGAMLAWSSVSRLIQQIAIAALVAAALLLSCLALASVLSQRNYLRGFYERRRALENNTRDLCLRTKVCGAGWTPAALIGGFVIAIVLSLGLLVLAIYGPGRPLLEGARLAGADLSSVQGLTLYDLTGACGDSSTKLPKDLTIKPCLPPNPSVQRTP